MLIDRVSCQDARDFHAPGGKGPHGSRLRRCVLPTYIYIYAHNYTICQCDVIGLEAIASRLEAIAIRLATASRYKHIDI